MAPYVPRNGGLTALSFCPQSGHEQRSYGPALVVSNDLFNRHTGLSMMCPITDTDRGFPFHVALPDGLDATGFVMVEQMKSVDFHSRRAKRIGAAPTALLVEVLALLDACLY